MILKTKEFNEIVDHIQNLVKVFPPILLKRICDDMDLVDLSEDQMNSLGIRPHPDGILTGISSYNLYKYVRARILNSKNIKLADFIEELLLFDLDEQDNRHSHERVTKDGHIKSKEFLENFIAKVNASKLDSLRQIIFASTKKPDLVLDSVENKIYDPQDSSLIYDKPISYNKGLSIKEIEKWWYKEKKYPTDLIERLIISQVQSNCPKSERNLLDY